MAFLDKVDCTTNSCWLWVGGKFNTGYERYKNKLAHRYIWDLLRGPIPPNMYVLHTCDVRNCVNPDHLFLGTQATNMLDMKLKKRSTLGEKHPNHKLTEEEVIQILEDKRSNYAEIGRQFNVTRRTISHIKRRVTWTHLNYPYTPRFVEEPTP